MDSTDLMKNLAQDIAAGFEALQHQLEQQQKIEADLRRQLVKLTVKHHSNNGSAGSDALSEWQDASVERSSEVEKSTSAVNRAQIAIAKLRSDKPNSAIRECPVPHKATGPAHPTAGKCPVQHRKPAQNFEDMEHDFTTQGKPSSLECPFAQNSKVDGIEDPIAAEFHADSLSAQSLDAARACGRCPIRFLDKHSPEEVAQYFENHKHELPRSHEICVKRYQQNDASIRQLDEKYGNIVSMIQGLGNKHKAYLPEGQTSVANDGGSTAAVENWAKDVDVNGIEDELEEESRISRFDKPLRDIRVGESPTRPWGISVPPGPARTPHEDQESAQLDETAAVKRPEKVVSIHNSKPRDNVKNMPQFFTDDQKLPGQVTINGPVFIGYSAEEASKLMSDWLNSGQPVIDLTRLPRKLANQDIRKPFDLSVIDTAHQQDHFSRVHLTRRDLLTMPRHDLGLEFAPWDNYISYIYPVKPPNRVRDRPMKVLALGMSRSGTDSLRTALEMLGYNGVYHGFEMLYNEVHDNEFWIPWLKRKHASVDYNNPTFLADFTTAEFDKALGKYEAVTDAPCYCFSHELLVAYPHAKVIVNRRKDLEAWRASFDKLLEQLMNNWFLIVVSRFNAELFWMRRHWWLCYVPYFKYDFKQNGTAAAHAHYGNVEKVLATQNREYLDWSVEEGWEPLCKFLDKDIPKAPFPHTNAGIEGLKEKSNRGIELYVQKAMINLGILTCIAATGLWWIIRRSENNK